MSLMTSSYRIEHDLCNLPTALPIRPFDTTKNTSVNLCSDLNFLHRFSTRMHFARNETVFNEGDEAKYAYRVVSGMVRLCKHTADGRRHVADFLLPDSLIGVIARDEYAFSAEAVVDSVLISYPRNQIEHLRASIPGATDRIFGFLTDQYYTMQRHMVVLSCQSAKERLASFLVRFARRKNLRSGDTLDLPMGRQDIANHLGLTVETVCRAIAKLKRDGVILVPTLNRLVLKNLGVLRALSGEAEII